MPLCGVCACMFPSKQSCKTKNAHVHMLSHTVFPTVAKTDPSLGSEVRVTIFSVTLKILLSVEAPYVLPLYTLILYPVTPSPGWSQVSVLQLTTRTLVTLSVEKNEAVNVAIRKMKLFLWHMTCVFACTMQKISFQRLNFMIITTLWRPNRMMGHYWSHSCWQQSCIMTLVSIEYLEWLSLGEVHMLDMLDRFL